MRLQNFCLATDPSVLSSILFSFIPFFLTAFILFHTFFLTIFLCLFHHHLFICTFPVPFSHFSVVFSFFSFQFFFFFFFFFFWFSPTLLSVSYLPPFWYACIQRGLIHGWHRPLSAGRQIHRKVTAVCNLWCHRTTYCCVQRSEHGWLTEQTRPV